MNIFLSYSLKFITVDDGDDHAEGCLILDWLYVTFIWRIKIQKYIVLAFGRLTDEMSNLMIVLPVCF